MSAWDAARAHGLALGQRCRPVLEGKRQLGFELPSHRGVLPIKRAEQFVDAGACRITSAGYLALVEEPEDGWSGPDAIPLSMPRVSSDADRAKHAVIVDGYVWGPVERSRCGTHKREWTYGRWYFRLKSGQTTVTAEDFESSDTWIVRSCKRCIAEDHDDG